MKFTLDEAKLNELRPAPILLGLEEVDADDFDHAEQAAEDLDQLTKDRPHKYIRREPTGDPKRRWRYYYYVPGHGVVTSESLKEGSRYAGVHHHDGKDHEGHYEVLGHDQETGQVRLRHTGSGHEQTMHHVEFAAHVNAQHASKHSAAKEAKHAEIREALAELKRNRTPAQAKRVERLLHQAVAQGWVTRQEAERFHAEMDPAAEKKGRAPRKPAEPVDDPDNPNSPNYRYRDTGEVAGSRKERAAEAIAAAQKAGDLVHAESIDWEGLEENPRFAREQITKAKLFGVVDWDSLKAAGMTPGAGFVVSKVYASVATEPEDSPKARVAYATGIETLRSRMEACKTPDEVWEALKEIRAEAAGWMIPPALEGEYKALEERASQLRSEQDQLRAVPSRINAEREAINSEIYKLQREADNRQRRGWKPSPEITAELAKLEKMKAEKAAEMDAYLAATPRLQRKEREGSHYPKTDIQHELDQIQQREREIRDKARQFALINPTAAAWNSLGDRFGRLIRGKSETFMEHLSTAWGGRVKDWSWAEKEPRPTRQGVERKPQFQLRVADKITRVGGKDIKVDSTEALKSTFGLREVQSGNWVLDDVKSAQWHVQRAAEGFSDLADLIGAKPEQVAMNGRLALAFGARGSGNALAHYEPVQRVINITKMKGGGSLAHEWFHALDNLIAEHHGTSAGAGFFATTAEHGRRGTIPADLNDAITGLRAAMLEGEHVERRTFVVTPETRKMAERVKKIAGPYGGTLANAIVAAKNAQQAVEAVDREEAKAKAQRQSRGKRWTAKDAETYESYRLAGVALHAPADEVSATVDTKVAGSSYLSESRKIDGKRAHPYWSDPKEMAARAFSAYVEDRLAERGQRNDYLSSHADNKFYVGAPGKPIPEGDERKRINAAFDRLFAAMRKHDTLAKALSGAAFPTKRHSGAVEE